MHRATAVGLGSAECWEVPKGSPEPGPCARCLPDENRLHSPSFSPFFSLLKFIELFVHKEAVLLAACISAAAGAAVLPCLLPSESIIVVQITEIHPGTAGSQPPKPRRCIHARLPHTHFARLMLIAGYSTSRCLFSSPYCNVI